MFAIAMLCILLASLCACGNALANEVPNPSPEDAAVGQPISSSYAPSCLVDGDDGELIYDGFIVYTERTAAGETVYMVF